jgi:hypothetical protein
VSKARLWCEFSRCAGREKRCAKYGRHVRQRFGKGLVVCLGASEL